MTLLISLPDSWNSFISTVDPGSLSDKNDPDSSKLISRILEEDLWTYSKNSAPEIALPARESHSSHHSNKPHCFHCGSKTHFLWDCPEPESNSDSDSDHNNHCHRHCHHLQLHLAAAYIEPNFAFWCAHPCQSVFIAVLQCRWLLFGSIKFYGFINCLSILKLRMCSPAIGLSALCYVVEMCSPTTCLFIWLRCVLPNPVEFCTLDGLLFLVELCTPRIVIEFGCSFVLPDPPVVSASLVEVMYSQTCTCCCYSVVELCTPKRFKV